MLKYLHEESATGNDEIHNPDIAPVDVGGWRFTSGVNFMIPSPRVIPAGGYLVVAAFQAAFQAAHPKRCEF